MENVFKKFNKDFFKSKKEIVWFDTTGIFELDSDRVVKIILDDVGSSKNFNGYWVEIYNKKGGLITKKFFKFMYHLEFNHRDTQPYFHCWYNSGKLDWYISRPKDTNVMVKTLFEYINMWK